ncbi:MAG: hypothetical protein ACKVWR_18170, partial [Acidimicrobiales bacterium]
EDPDPLIVAFRAASPPVSWTPPTLRVLARTDLQAILAESYPPEAQLPIGVAPFTAWQLVYADGAWRMAAHGGCTRFGWIDGLMASPWELDPTQPAPGPGSTELAVLVHAHHCASGQLATGRVRPPHIVYGESTVEIAITVTPPTGAQTCAGSPPTPFTVHLDQPLGARQLLDSGREPIAAPGPPW